ncbi:Ig-like domain-containing protein [Caldanaerobius polysaccharolyticus]|uniref:Ig-like domain-containing protein n=1 Tax=Caldanaerobius polysaccharolyticus TaxID=44256 RepID=UPI00047B36F5|nr:Ig-like domain-containing protein [Caldanaerobius polysaccharolyticus]
MKKLFKFLSFILTMFLMVVNSPTNVVWADPVNLVQNPGFESGLDSWTVDQSQSNIASINSSGKAEEIKSGNNSLAIYYGSSYTLKVTQTITNIPPGKYSLTVYAEGDPSENKANIQLFANNYGGPQLTASITNTGWGKWVQYSINNIEVTTGTCTIGIQVDSNAPYWGTFDDFAFIRVGEIGASPTINSIKPITVNTVINNPPQLPSVVTAVYNDGSTKQVDVTWDAIDPLDYQQIHSFNVYGTVSGTVYRAQATVIVNYKSMDLNNNGLFDVGDLAVAMYYYQTKSEDVNWSSAKVADINNDGIVDLIDMKLIARQILEKN